MNEIELKKLWDALQARFDVGTFEEFKSKMSTPEMRMKFYNIISGKLDIGSYDAYEKRLSGSSPAPTKSPVSSTPKGNVNDLNSYPPCVRFGQPKANSKGVIGIDGIGKYKGMTFFNNGRYADNGQVKSYQCDAQQGNDGIIYKLILDKSSVTSTDTNTSTDKPTTPTKSQYHSCDSFPFMKWCKHEKIKEIQRWIGFPTKYQTGNFGPITERGLKDLKIDITNGITLDIYNQIKTEHLAINTTDDNPEPTLIPNAEIPQQTSDLPWER